MDMVLNAFIYLKIACQRQEDLLAEAERLRIADACANARVAPTAGPPKQQARASRPASKPGIDGHLEAETRLEV
jgi:hypothetical protein